MTLAVTRSAALVLALGLVGAGCTEKRAPAQKRTLFFRGEPAAQIEERVEDHGGGKSVQRRTRLPSGELVETTARLDARGFLEEAQYRRGERRTVSLVDRQRALTDGATRLAVTAPVVAIDMIRHLEPAGPTDVTLVDLASGDALPGRVERKGAAVVVSDAKGGAIARCNVEGLCTGPGAFSEGDTAPSLDTAPVEIPLVAKGRPKSLRLVGIAEVFGALALDGPGQRAGAPGIVEYVDDAAQPLDAPPPAPAERAAALFIESADPAIVEFAGPKGDPLADAARIADAVFPLVDPRKTDAPPSARTMLASGGDCDGAAALVTAGLRALGHAARPVVGYRFVEAGAGGRFVPHAWVEVYTSTGWVLIDATVPRVGGPADGYLKLFHGLGSALTMGRVLGRLRIEPASAVPTAPPSNAGGR